MQQKKVGDSPSYEHLSRPYLEKMKFLDHFIQPRKSYRHVGHTFTTPSSMNIGMMDSSDSSKSSIQILNPHIANSLDDSFPQQFYHHLTQLSQAQIVVKNEVHEQEPPDPFNKSDSRGIDVGLHNHHHHNNMPSSSSSIISQESPATMISNSTTAETDDNNTGDTAKRRRSISTIDNDSSLLHQSHKKQAINRHSSSFDHDEHSSTNNDDASGGHQSPNVHNEFLYPYYHQTLRMRKSAESVSIDNARDTFPTPNEFLHPFYSQAMAAGSVRNSEQLLGELVTSELLKMSKERKKHVQKKILEILFFDD